MRNSTNNKSWAPVIKGFTATLLLIFLVGLSVSGQPSAASEMGKSFVKHANR